MKHLTHLLLATTLAFLPLASAQDRPEHFKGKPAPTLAVALANLAEANAQLAAIVQKANPTPEDLLAVHQLSYTLEVALAKIGAEQARLAALMEEVHLGSEANDVKRVKTNALAYLQGIAPLTR